MTATRPDESLLFHDFLQYLRRQGFDIGLNHYVQLQRLLELLDGRCEPEQLRSLVCPLIATNEKEQRQFNSAFAQFYPLFGTPPEDEHHERRSSETTLDRIRMTLTGQHRISSGKFEAITGTAQAPIKPWKVAVGALLAMLVWFGHGPAGEPIETDAAVRDTTGGREGIVQQPDTGPPTVVNVATSEGSTGDDVADITITPAAMVLEPGSSAFFTATLIGPTGEELENVPLTWSTTDSGIVTTGPGANVTKVTATAVGETMVEVSAGSRTTSANIFVVRESWFARNMLLVWLATIGIPLVWFGAYELHRLSRRKLVLERERQKKPPAVWPVRADETVIPFANFDGFAHATRDLRQRLASDTVRLDVPQTIAATIEASGYPTFKYTSDTRPPEYLVLIEREAARDHQADYFDNLMKALRENGVHVTEYFYDSDPRICFARTDEKRVLLVELRRRFPTHRLLVFGTGAAMIDPVTERLAPWIGDFVTWKERAVLTPIAPGKWRLRELALARHFTVLPSTIGALDVLVDYFEAEAKPDFRQLRRSRVLASPPSLNGKDDLQRLRQYLGKGGFRWLCACAVYPELHWGLTLRLGKVSELGDGLLTEQNLLRLVRLPWFRDGAMPDELRVELMEALDAKAVEAVRKVIIEVLESNPPPEETIAAQRHAMNLVAQRLSLHARDRKKRKELEREAAELPRHLIQQDYAFLKLLENAPKTALALPLPKRLRKIFFRDGIPLFGAKTGMRAAALMLVLAIASLGVSRFTKPSGADTAQTELLATLNGHTGSVNAVAFNPDGSLIATASSDSTARLWDPATGDERATLRGHTDVVTDVAFSPDGTLLATASRDGTAKLWDVATIQELAMLVHTGPVTSVAFDPDGAFLATAGSDNTATLWTVVTLDPLLTLTGHSVAFNPGTGGLATASNDSTAKVWTELGQEIVRLSGHTDAVNDVAFSPDGTRLATISDDETAILWDASTGEPLTTFRGHGYRVLSVAFTPGGTRLATTSFGGRTRLWDIESRKVIAYVSGHTGWANDVAFSADGTRMATAGEDDRAKVWVSPQYLELATRTDEWVSAVNSIDIDTLLAQFDPSSQIRMSWPGIPEDLGSSRGGVADFFGGVQTISVEVSNLAVQPLTDRIASATFRFGITKQNRDGAQESFAGDGSLVWIRDSRTDEWQIRSQHLIEDLATAPPPATLAESLNDEPPARTAKDSIAGVVSRNVWERLDETTNTCDEFDYFPDGGMRIFSCHVASIMPEPYELLQRLSGEPAFLRGPHTTSDLSLTETTSFGYYNPRFVNWMVDHLIPGAESAVFRRMTQPVYDRYVKPLATIFFVTYHKIRANPACFDREVANYASLIESGEFGLYYYERFYSFMNELFCDNPDGGIGGDGGYDGNVVNTSVAFWIRRAIDGTIDEFYRGLEKLVRTYDRNLLTTGISLRETVPAPSPFNADGLIALGEALESANDLDSAIAVYLLAANMSEQTLARGTEVLALQRAGVALARAGNPDSGMVVLRRALQRARTMVDGAVAIPLLGIGRVYAEVLAQYDSAAAYLDQAIRASQAAGDVRTGMTALGTLGPVLFAAGDLDAGRQAMRRADSILMALQPLATVAAVYRGTAVNQTSGRRVNLVVRFGPPGASDVSGHIVYEDTLFGSGPFTGQLRGDSIAFVSQSGSGESIRWTGTTTGAEIEGVYEVIGGYGTGQLGAWETRLITGTALAPSGPRPGQATAAARIEITSDSVPLVDGIMLVDNMVALNARVYGPDGNPMPNMPVRWRSSDTGVALMRGGFVEAIDTGTTIITATTDSASSSMALTVVPLVYDDSLTVTDLDSAMALYREALMPGVWKGTVVEQDSTSYPVTMVLRGDGGGSIEYPTFPCGGSLTLVGARGRKLVFRESIAAREVCFNRGTIYVEMQADGTLSWEWSYPASYQRGVWGSATLRRLP